jgi:hypothetical protein
MNSPHSEAEDRSQEPYLQMLLQFVRERKVIPVVGPGLLTVELDGKEVPLYSLVAERLAKALHVDATTLASGYGLNEVVCAHLDKPGGLGKRNLVYATVHTILEELRPKPPRALLELAEITDFDLYVSVTADTLMQQALNKERFNNQPRTGSLAYTTNQPDDLPTSREKLAGPVVYHLLGRVSATPDYVVTEEDALEYLSALQSESNQPKNLFDALENYNLLILGCKLSNWPARFFLRAAKRHRLMNPRNQVEAVVDPDAPQDRDLVLFVGHFSQNTWLIPWTPQQFVSRLHELWQGRQQPAAGATVAETVVRGIPDLKPGFVFISYSSQNLEQAERLRRALDKAGIDTWFDKEQLESGDAWEYKISENIRRCAVFIPLLSQGVETRPEAFFRKEWSAALERRSGMAENLRFVLPVVLDDLPRDAPTVPGGIRALQWTSLPGGDPTPQFIEVVQALVKDHRRREKGLA